MIIGTCVHCDGSFMITLPDGPLPAFAPHNCEDDWNYNEEVVDGEIERLKAENKRLKCCGNCEQWEIDTETGPYFMDTNRADCEHGDPAHKCDKWERRQ